MPESEDWPRAQPEGPDRGRARDNRTGSDAVEARIKHQTRWVDLQIKQAMERGEFDNLPGKANHSATSDPWTIGTGG